MSGISSLAPLREDNGDDQLHGAFRGSHTGLVVLATKEMSVFQTECKNSILYIHCMEKCQYNGARGSLKDRRKEASS